MKQQNSEVINQGKKLVPVTKITTVSASTIIGKKSGSDRVDFTLKSHQEWKKIDLGCQ